MWRICRLGLEVYSYWVIEGTPRRRLRLSNRVEGAGVLSETNLNLNVDVRAEGFPEGVGGAKDGYPSNKLGHF